MHPQKAKGEAQGTPGSASSHAASGNSHPKLSPPCPLYRTSTSERSPTVTTAPGHTCGLTSGQPSACSCVKYAQLHQARTHTAPHTPRTARRPRERPIAPSRRRAWTKMLIITSTGGSPAKDLAETRCTPLNPTDGRGTPGPHCSAKSLRTHSV